MNSYEIMLVISTKASKEAINSLIKKMEKIISKDGGKISQTQEMGFKRLAYPINNQTEGVYLLIYYNTPSQTIKKLKEMLKLEEAVLRHLIIKQKGQSKSKTEEKTIENKEEEVAPPAEVAPLAEKKEENKGAETSGEL